MNLNIAGMENLSKENYDFINKLVEKTAKHSHHIQSLNLDVHTHRTSGTRQRFSIHAKALTDSGFFKAESTDWKMNIAIKEVIRKLDKHIHHSLDKK
tara:strand:+ start:113 stop:403 length:291 start_codon:yes stop_codon:yes gene_type:complete